MGAIAVNLFNCMLEGATAFLCGNIFETTRPRKAEILRYLLAFFPLAIFITWTDFSGMTLLPINMLGEVLCFYIAFFHRPLKALLGNSILAYICLVDIQILFMCLLPQSWMPMTVWSVLINSLTLIIAIGLYILSRKQQWSHLYKENAKTIWIYIVTLCIPTVITAQIAVWGILEIPHSTLVIILLLQLLYLCGTVVFFLLINQKNEKKELETTHKHIAELNIHLDDSRQHIHDFNKHLRFLRNAVVTYSQSEKLTEIVNTYCEDLITVYDEEEILLQLDSPIFRALLYGRHAQATQLGIRFFLNATPLLPDFPIPNYHLVEIFDNIMDNAFECVAELPQQLRWIRATLSAIPEDGTMLYEFYVENPYREINLPAILSEESYSSKKGHKGIGLQRVSRLISDSGGKLILFKQNGIQGDTFVAKIQYINTVN